MDEDFHAAPRAFVYFSIIETGPAWLLDPRNNIAMYQYMEKELGGTCDQRVADEQRRAVSKFRKWEEHKNMPKNTGVQRFTSPVKTTNKRGKKQVAKAKTNKKTAASTGNAA